MAQWDTDRDGVSSTQVVQFVGNAELAVTVSVRGAELGASVGVPKRDWNTDVVSAHFTDLAFDRLMGVPVTLANGAP